MALKDILVSLHGKRLGLGFDGNMVMSRARGLDQDQEVFTRCVTKFITSAQLLALFGTPIEVVPAPGAGRFIQVEKWMAYKPAGTAYAGIAGTEDLTLKYTNASGAQVASPIEATGFLDQATAQTSWATTKGSADNATPASALAVANAAVVAHLLVGEITTGDTGVFIKVWYHEYPMVLVAD
jgi:hypothetical protein